MARMSREFTLVLLGASLLTAGYFLWPGDDDPVRQADDAAGSGGGSGSGGYVHRSRFVIIPIVTSTGGRVSTVSRPTGVTRSGFGSLGARFGGIS
jgi:hypothetical protein